VRPKRLRASSRFARRSLARARQAEFGRGNARLGRPALWVASLAMPGHRASEAPKNGPVRGQKRRFYVPPPEQWDYGERGRPSWIGRGGRWAVVVERPFQIELPQGWPKARAKRGERGVPPLEERKPEKILYAAWLKECGGDTYVEVARQLRFRIDRLPGAEHAAKKKAMRYVERGRVYASALGIWPWASWVKGVPPKGAWWRDDRCRNWLLLWQVEAVERAARQPAIDSALLVKEAFERQLLRVVEINSRARGF
jgi:hypothetical protein